MLDSSSRVTFVITSQFLRGIDHFLTCAGVLLVVPLDLAITPMRVLQDPLYGPECRAMYEEGEVDDRFLMILFLMVERLRENSSWNPYVTLTFLSYVYDKHSF